MYVIIPCITGASKPNERLYQNDWLQYGSVLQMALARVTFKKYGSREFELTQCRKAETDF